MTFNALIRSNRVRMLAIFALIVATQLFDVSSTYLFSPMINEVAAGRFFQFCLFLVTQFGLSLLLNLSYNGANYLFSVQVQGYFHLIRQRLAAHYYDQPEKASEMTNHFTQDLDILTKDYADTWFYMTNDIISAFLVIGTLLAFHWLLLTISLVIAILSFLVPKGLEAYTNRATETVSKQNEHYLSIIDKWGQGLQELRRYKASQPFLKALSHAGKNVERSNVRRTKANRRVQMLQALINTIGTVSVPLTAGWLYFNHQISFGAIIAAGYFAENIFGALENIGASYSYLVSTKRLRQKLLKLQEPIATMPNADAPEQIRLIQGRNLSADYENSATIIYPDFTIKAGDKVLLTGASGTGKSTLLKLLLGQLKPKNGEICYQDENGNLLQIAPYSLGYLAQDLTLFSGTICENVTMHGDHSAHDVAEALAQADLDQDSTTEIDLDHLTLSGGQKQKVILARAICHQFPVVLLDEALSAIDEVSQNKILKNLTAGPQTLIMVAHHLSREQRALFDQEIQLQGKQVVK